MNNDAQDFDTYVLARSNQVAVLVDFWAPWCGPCKMLGPMVERLAAEAAGKWLLVKINTEEQPELAARFQIRGIPNLKLFHHGKVIAELAGALPEPQLRVWLKDNLPKPKRESMAKARELLRSGHAAEAARLLQPIAEACPDDAELAALTARALVFNEPEKAAAIVADQPLTSAWEDAIVIVRTLARLFSLDKNPQSNLPPSPLRGRYFDAIRRLQHERFPEALSGFIAVLEEKSSYDDGQAKFAVLAIFKHLGLRHPITEEHYRAFSSAVNV